MIIKYSIDSGRLLLYDTFKKEGERNANNSTACKRTGNTRK